MILKKIFKMSVREEEALFLKKLECQIINIEEMMELEKL